MNKTQNRPLRLRPGERVRVRSPEDILATLDGNGCLDNMPFMPEMLDCCGKEFSVYSRADKTCDTATQTGGRRLTDSVHLRGQRCDGSAHGACQAECLNFWKESWLERIDDESREANASNYSVVRIESARSEIAKHAVLQSGSNDIQVYSCQATRLPAFTLPLSPWDMRQYWRDVTSNNVAITRLLRVAFLSLYAKLVGSGIAYSLWTSAYNAVQKARNKPLWPIRSGTLTSTPTELLGLEVGELVLSLIHI